MRTFKVTLLVLLPAAGFAGFLGWQWLTGAVAAPGPLAADKLVYIPPKTPVHGIADTLLAEGVIGDRTAFLVDARWQNRIAGLHAGEYQFPAHATISAVVALLQSGKTYQHKLTVPEGLTVADVIGLLGKEPVLTGDAGTPPPEGSLLPETYKFSYGDTRQSVLSRMEKSMQDELDALWQKRPADYTLTRDQMVTLASIVEKETGIAAERPRVAGVFMNRLAQGMPLQSDPTVIYALTDGKQPLGRALTRDDLKKPSPYNTYTTVGLPPGPIANPGRAALEAALHPEKNDFIYFVADGSGGHAFAKTLQEHTHNVAHWRTLAK